MPTRLRTLVVAQSVAPPVETREQALPFGDLAWENFERLNLRLAQARGAVEQGADLSDAGDPAQGRLSARQADLQASLYGTAGQEQHGIDLYVRLPEDPDQQPPRDYLTLQSRRVLKVTEGKLRKAVTDFLKGPWAPLSRVFVYSVSLSGVRKQFRDEVERQRTRLAKEGIAFEVWDAEALSTRLKHLPELVDDFFGRPWVERFCSPEDAARLSERLDAAQVGELRTELARFYTRFFEVHDSGMVALQQADAPHLLLRDRFVVPDVMVPLLPGAAAGTPLVEPPRLSPLQWYEQSQAALYQRGAEPPWGVDAPGPDSGLPGVSEQGSGHAPWPASAPEVRTAIDTWLAAGERHVLVGGPGSGKSTVLRFAFLDLLSDRPVLNGWVSRFGDRLPVWLPFHFFTRRRAKYDDVQASLEATLQAWLEQNDEGHLWPLVRKALKDQRLLLIVDGLDEWVTEKAARTAASALETFLQTRDLPALVSTRPYGLARIALSRSSWQQAQLAPLSTGQQRDLARTWFHAKYAQAALAQPHDEHAGSAVERQVDDFSGEVDTNSELRQLAGVPLFLLLLVNFRLAGIRLPRRRFDVYKSAVDQLLRDHPAKRASAAAQTDELSGLSEDDVRVVLAQTAFAHQNRGAFGPIPKHEVRRDIIAALSNPAYLARDPSTAATESERFIKVAEGELGVLVLQGPETLGFLHRALMEQLAAEYVVDHLGPSQVPALITDKAGDPRWSEVILAIMWRLPPHAMDAAVQTLADLATPDEPAALMAGELLAEVVFGGFRLPAVPARRYTQQILDTIESHPSTAFRQRLLRLIMSGLNEPSLNGLIEERLTRWAVDHQPLTPRVFTALGQVVDDERLSTPIWPFLTRALINEDVTVVRAAAASLVTRYGTGPRQEELRTTLLDAARSAPTADHMALILQQVFQHWPDDPSVIAGIAHGRRQGPLPLRLVALAAALGVLGGTATRQQHPVSPNSTVPLVEPDEREWLVNQLDLDDASQDLWRPLLADALLTAVQADAATSTRVLDRCLKILTKDTRLHGDRALAWTLLLLGYHDDPRAVDFVCTVIREDRGLITFLGDELLAHTYPQNEKVAAAIEHYLATEQSTLLDRNRRTWARMDQGPVMRRILLENLTTSSTPHWSAAALITHWPDDAEAVTALRTILTGDSNRASQKPFSYRT